MQFQGKAKICNDDPFEPISELFNPDRSGRVIELVYISKWIEINLAFDLVLRFWNQPGTNQYSGSTCWGFGQSHRHRCATRFSWRLDSDKRNVSQTAYEFMLAKVLRPLAKGAVWEFWQSFMRSINVVDYGGPTLEFREKYCLARSRLGQLQKSLGLDLPFLLAKWFVKPAWLESPMDSGGLSEEDTGEQA